MVNYNAVGLDLSGIGNAFASIAQKRQEEEEKRRRAAMLGAYAESALGGLGAPAEPTRGAQLVGMGGSLPSMAQAGPIGDYARAIQTNESGGNYAAVGPRHPKLGRALGAYQVMEANVGPWTKEVLGQELTPEQFLASKQAQDTVFNAKFGENVRKYGNPQDAASVWFTGRPLAEGANKRDVLGTTGAAYVQKFNRSLGGGGAPAAVASAEPTPGAGRVVGTDRNGRPIRLAQLPPRDAEASPVADMPAAESVPTQYAAPGGAPAAAPVAAAPTIPPQRQQMLRQMIASGDPKLQELALREIQTLAAGPKYEFKEVGGRLFRTDSRGNAVEVPVPQQQRQRRTSVVGENLVDQDTGEVVYRGQREQVKDLITPEERRAAGIPDTYTGPAQRKPDNTIVMPGSAAPPKPESAYDAARAKDFAEQRKAIDEGEALATKGRNAIKVMERSTNDPNFYSGAGGQAVKAAKSALVALGIKDPTANTAAEVFEAFSREVTMNKMGGKLGAGVSNTDLTFIEGMGPRLTTSIAGNKLLLKYTDKILERQQMVGKMAREYEKRNNGRLDAGFNAELAEWSEKNPIFTPEEMAAAEQAAAEISPASQGLLDGVFGQRGQPKVIQTPKGPVTIEPWKD